MGVSNLYLFMQNMMSHAVILGLRGTPEKPMFFFDVGCMGPGCRFLQGKWCWDTMRKDPSCWRPEPAPAGCEGAWNTRRSPFSGETGGFFRWSQAPRWSDFGGMARGNGHGNPRRIHVGDRHMFRYPLVDQRSWTRRNRISSRKSTKHQNNIYIYTYIFGWWFGTFFIFPYIYIYLYIGNNHHIWLSYFSEGVGIPPTRYRYIYIYIHTHTLFYGKMVIASDCYQLILVYSFSTPRCQVGCHELLPSEKAQWCFERCVKQSDTSSIVFTQRIKTS